MNGVIITLGVCVVMPIAIVFLYFHYRKQETEKKSEIILSALDKNPNLEVSNIVRSLNNSAVTETIKERVLKQFQYGLIFTSLGLALLVLAFLGNNNYIHGLRNISELLYVLAFLILPVGIAYLVAFFVSKKYYKKDLVDPCSDDVESANEINA